MACWSMGCGPASCSRVLMLCRTFYRRTEKEGADGMMVEGVRPYIMDLGSVNGTFVNNERIEGERYYELLEQVTIYSVANPTAALLAVVAQM